MDLDFSDDFIVQDKFSMRNFSTEYEGNLSKNEGKKMLVEEQEKLRELQQRLYSDGSKSILIVLQAMDAAGKDSLIKHVFGGVNPQGCEVHSFKTPSSKEYDHDFLWRHYIALPEKGKIGIFNRSHYESVLVCKVHPRLDRAFLEQMRLQILRNIRFRRGFYMSFFMFFDEPRSGDLLKDRT